MNYKKILFITCGFSLCLITILVISAKRAEKWKFVDFKRIIKGNLKLVSSVQTNASIENIFIAPDNSVYVQLLDQPSLYKTQSDLSTLYPVPKLNVPSVLMDLKFHQQSYSVFDAKQNAMTEISY